MDINKSIFISHSKHDETEVKHVIAWLEELGLKTWASFEDIHDLNFLKKISTAITRQDYFLLVLSKNSIASDNVHDEIYKAKESKKKIFIYALENVSYPDEIDLILLRLQRIDKFKFPKDHLSRLAKIILNESSARPSEVERHVSNCLANFNAKTEQTRLEYLANIRAWTDEYLNSRWENGKFKREPSKICSEQLKDLADSLGLKDNDILKAQQIKRDKKRFLYLLESALRKRTISKRSLETLERKRYESGVSKNEVKESISKRQFIPPIMQEVQSSSFSRYYLDIDWLIESLSQRREFLADKSYGDDKSDQKISSLHVKDERETSNSILDSHLAPKKHLLDVQKSTCSDEKLSPSRIALKNSDIEKPAFSEPQKALSIPSKDKEETAASGNSIVNTKSHESTNQIDKTKKLSSKSYQFSSKSIVYKPSKNPKTDFVELTEIHQEGSLVIFIGKKGSRQTAYQEKFETGFVRAIRWNRFFKLYIEGNSTSLQIDYISGSKDCQVFEEFLSDLGIPVMDAPSTIDATRQPSRENSLSRDQQIIEVNAKNPINQIQTSGEKALSTPDKQSSGITPATAESKEPKAVFEFSDDATVVSQVVNGKEVAVIALRKAEQTQGAFIFSGKSTIGGQNIIKAEKFTEIFWQNTSAKLVQNNHKYILIYFTSNKLVNGKIRILCDSIGVPIHDDDDSRSMVDLGEQAGEQIDMASNCVAEKQFSATKEKTISIKEKPPTLRSSSFICSNKFLVIENSDLSESLVVQVIKKTSIGLCVSGYSNRSNSKDIKSASMVSFSFWFDFSFWFEDLELIGGYVKFNQYPSGEPFHGRFDAHCDEGKQLHSFLESKDAGLHSSITSPWIHPSRSEDRNLCDTLLKHQQFQERLITKIRSFDAASRLDQLFRNLKQPLNLLYGVDLDKDGMMNKILKKHGQLQNQSYKPLVYFNSNGLIFRRSLIVFDRGVSFQASNISRHHFKFGIPCQRIAGRINFQVNNNNLKVRALSPTLKSAKTEVTYDFRLVQSHCQAFSDSLLKILTELDDHQINYAKLRESFVNELWEGLSSHNFVAPVTFHLYGDSVITPLAKSSLDPILIKLFNNANTKIPCEQDYLFSLSASYSTHMYNYRCAFLVTLHGIAVASKTALEINGQFINWSDLSGFIFAQTGRSFFEIKIKTKCLRSQILWPTLPGKEKVFSEIAAFVMSLKKRLSTLPAR